MKKISFLVAVLLICISCNCQKKAVAVSNSDKKTTAINQQPIIMEYEAYTRGSYYKVTVENQKMSVIRKRETQPTIAKIPDVDWNEIMGFYKNLNIKGLAKLKAPSEARFYDGAPIANFKVISGTTTYQTTDFDGGVPPAEIKKMVEKIIALADNKVTIKL